MEFPLRMHHIADATGSTPVHACKVINKFRRLDIIAIEDRMLTILNPAKLRRIAFD